MPSVKEVTVAKPTSDQEAACKSWPIWRSEPSTFEWTYTDKETCLLLEGKVTVTDETDSVSFAAGDLVVFPKGLSCTWNVQEPVVKHYNLG